MCYGVLTNLRRRIVNTSGDLRVYLRQNAVQSFSKEPP